MSIFGIKKQLSSLALCLYLTAGFAGFASAHEGDNEAFQHSDSSGAPARVDVDEQVIRALEIKVEPVKSGTVKNSLQATGEVKAAETQSFDVNPSVSGVVKQVFAKQGDVVKKGEILATVHSIEVADNLTKLINEKTRISGEIAKTKTQYASDIKLQQNTVDLAKATFDREEGMLKEGISALKNYQVAKNAYQSAQVKLSTLQQRLVQDVKLLEKESSVTISSAKGQLKIMGISPATVDAALDSDQVTANLPIIAPVGGTITTRNITLGEQVDAEHTVFSIVNLDPIWVMVDVYQEQIPRVKLNQEVIITTPSQETLRGTISSVGSVVDEETKTLHVRIVAQNPKGILRPGMFVEALISTGDGNKKGLVIPESAVSYFQEKPYVFLRHEKHFEPKFITIGSRSDEQVEVIDGLKEGDMVVSSGSAQLAAQALLKPDADKEHGDEENQDHAEHAHESAKQANSPVQMLIFFFIGFATAFAAVFTWIAVIKRNKKSSTSDAEQDN
ncbi:efflux RND transporter periplasmic adaptor subunit [bacterium]|nr:efflux RND transporter periplasmic adaptor subunit [bacterium]QQR56277.1 MAG: efflux RND transporter periplasmic adaptor subunit [Candidatus Melainabacteria bacterium]